MTSRHVLSIARFSVAVKECLSVLRPSLLNKIEALLISIVCLLHVSASHLYFSTYCPSLFPSLISMLLFCDCLYLTILLALFSFPASYLFFIFSYALPPPLPSRSYLFISFLRRQANHSSTVSLSLCSCLVRK